MGVLLKRLMKHVLEESIFKEKVVCSHRFLNKRNLKNLFMLKIELQNNRLQEFSKKNLLTAKKLDKFARIWCFHPYTHFRAKQ